MTVTTFKGDVAFTGDVDLSAADLSSPDAVDVTANHTWSGDQTFTGDVVLPSGVVDPVNMLSGRRTLGADAALTLAATNRSVELNITTGTTVTTMTATHAGHRVRVYAGIRSGGAYTLACTRGATSGAVTLDAVGEGCDIVYSGTEWRLESLLGGATFA